MLLSSNEHVGTASQGGPFSRLRDHIHHLLRWQISTLSLKPCQRRPPAFLRPPKHGRAVAVGTNLERDFRVPLPPLFGSVALGVSW